MSGKELLWACSLFALVLLYAIGGNVSGVCLEADCTSGDGLHIVNASDDGVHVEKAADDGLYIVNASSDGVLIDKAGDFGVRIVKAGADGVWVEEAADDGVYVSKASDDGVYVGEASDGVHIAKTGSDGMLVEEAGDDGVQVLKAGDDGVYIVNASANGVYVGAARNGVYISKSKDDGVYVGSAEDAFYVSKASDDGMYVGTALGDGLEIIEVGENFIAAGPSDNRKFLVDKHGKVRSTGSSVPADFAELMATKENNSTGYEPGDVLVISDSRDRSVELSNASYSTTVIGVYSKNPGILGSNHPMNDTQDNELPVAVMGIVPCKVSAESGPIHRGDILTTSSTPGHAMRALDIKPGTILGKALGELESGTGVIEIMVALQ